MVSIIRTVIEKNINKEKPAFMTDFSLPVQLQSAIVAAFYFKFSTIRTAITKACSLVAVEYPSASSLLVVLRGANILSPMPLIILFATMKYALSLAHEEIRESSAKSAGLI